ncbi:hypothetical protein [Streptomyces sp. NPDC001435]|uniref:hypothetical protein n=1 Tax=unclassified Streptomyces TaxID=2593676 RepID=UPI00367D4B6E
MTTPEGVQAICDAIPAGDKKMDWIKGSTCRFDGYNYSGEHPEEAINCSPTTSADGTTTFPRAPRLPPPAAARPPP